MGPGVLQESHGYFLVQGIVFRQQNPLAGKISVGKPGKGGCSGFFLLMEGKAPQHAYELGGKQGLGNESVGSGFFCGGLVFSSVIG